MIHTIMAVLVGAALGFVTFFAGYGFTGFVLSVLAGGLCK